MAAHIARNTRILELPTRPAADVYSGPLHRGLDLASLSAPATARAERSLVIASALWGALRPSDRIPGYRLRVWSSLVGLDRLEPMWRTVIPDLLARLAGSEGVVLDLRPPSFQALGMPTGLSDRTIAVHIGQFSGGGRRLGDVVTKRLRGEAARHVLESGVEPEDPDDLTDILADRWPVRLAEPERPGKPWTVAISGDD